MSFSVRFSAHGVACVFFSPVLHVAYFTSHFCYFIYDPNYRLGVHKYHLRFPWFSCTDFWASLSCTNRVCYFIKHFHPLKKQLPHISISKSAIHYRKCEISNVIKCKRVPLLGAIMIFPIRLERITIVFTHVDLGSVAELVNALGIWPSCVYFHYIDVFLFDGLPQLSSSKSLHIVLSQSCSSDMKTGVNIHRCQSSYRRTHFTLIIKSI